MLAGWKAGSALRSAGMRMRNTEFLSAMAAAGVGASVGAGAAVGAGGSVGAAAAGALVGAGSGVGAAAGAPQAASTSVKMAGRMRKCLYIFLKTVRRARDAHGDVCERWEVRGGKAHGLARVWRVSNPWHWHSLLETLKRHRTAAARRAEVNHWCRLNEKSVHQLQHSSMRGICYGMITTRRKGFQQHASPSRAARRGRIFLKGNVTAKPMLRPAGSAGRKRPCSDTKPWADGNNLHAWRPY